MHHYRNIMKKLHLLITLTAGILLAGCSGVSSDSYTSAIPEDAMVVAYFDINQLVEKSEIMDLITPAQRQSLAEAASSEMDGGDREFVKEVVMNLDNTGIDTSAPVYLYMTSNIEEPCGVVLIKLNDKDRMNRVFETIEEQNGEVMIMENNGRTIIETYEDGFHCGYNESALVFTFGDNDRKAERELIKALDAIEQNVQTIIPDFGNSDIAYHLNMDEVINALAAEDPYLARDIEPMMDYIKGTRTTLMLEFTNGHITAEYRMDNASEKALEMQQAVMADKVNNKFLNYVSKDALAVMNLNINGEKLFNTLKVNELFRQLMLEEFANNEAELDLYLTLAKPYVECVAGDITAALNSLEEAGYGDPVVNAVAMAEVKDESLINAISAAALSEGMTEYESKKYLLQIDERNTAYVGQEDGMLFGSIGTKPQTYNDSAKRAEWIDDVDDSYSYIVLNLKGMFTNPFISEIFYEEFGDYETMKFLRKTFDYAYANCESASEAKIDVVMEDKSQNSLKVIVDYFRADLQEIIREEIEDAI